MAMQQTFSDYEYSHRKHRTRREEFLMTMDSLLPWEEWAERIRPCYPSGKRGRPPRGIETMLRMYLLQKWYGLSAEALEDTINDSYAMRLFMGIDFLSQQVPGSSTLGRFRRILKKQGLDEKISRDITDRLQENGLLLQKKNVTEPFLSERQDRNPPSKE